MKKQIFSVFLALCMAITPALAAGTDASSSAQEEPSGTTIGTDGTVADGATADGTVKDGTAADGATEDGTVTDGTIPDSGLGVLPPVVTLPDIAGHWAAASLQQAVELGIIKGVNGKAVPDRAVTGAETLTILNRTLGAPETTEFSSLPQVPSGAWYSAEITRALRLGLIDAGDNRDFDVSATRAEAFVMLARAFVYERAEATNDELLSFPDTAGMTTEQKRAAAALVGKGIVQGDLGGSLNPSKDLTRAEFVTMLLRIVQNFPTVGESFVSYPGGTIVKNAEVKLDTENISGDLIFACDTTSLTAKHTSVAGRMVFKGMQELKLSLSQQTSFSTLALDPAGTADVKIDNKSSVSTLVIGGTGGAISVSGAVGNIEITASGRAIDLTGMTADSLTIAGSGNTITMNGKVDAVAILQTGKNTSLILNKATKTIDVAGIGTAISGKGSAEEVTMRAVQCNVVIKVDNTVDAIDHGLEGVTVNLTTTADKVPAGGSLTANISFSGVANNKIVKAEWYQDGVALSGYANSSFSLTPSAVSTHRSEFTFKKGMATSVTIGFRISYENPSTGQTETVSAKKTVPIENYSDEWYYQRDVNRVLNLVSSSYRGNYTIAYAVNNDYKAYEKEVFVNAKGYASNTGYLIWINRAYQHVNIFTGSKGNWKLAKSFLVGTGSMASQTPTGLTTVSYKSYYGWTTSTYTVRPVIGFYPGSGYAFHSRLFYPGTTTLMDNSIGYPVSHGCIRMYNDDVNWIYNNIPVGTAVAIF